VCSAQVVANFATTDPIYPIIDPEASNFGRESPFQRLVWFDAGQNQEGGTDVARRGSSRQRNFGARGGAPGQWKGPAGATAGLEPAIGSVAVKFATTWLNLPHSVADQ
jgi:hypothetical protein